MIFIILIIILLALLVALLFIEAVKVNLVFDTEKTDMSAKVFWLYPFVKVIATMENARPKLKFYLFKKLLFTKVIKKTKKSKNGIQLLKITNPQDISITADYGFNDPFITGITCGAINVASQFINIDSIKHSPHFMPENDYIYIDATARVNLGTAFVNLLKQKFTRRNY